MNKKTLNIIISIIFLIIILSMGFVTKSKNNDENSTLLTSQIDAKESKIQELNEELSNEKEKLTKLQEEYNKYKNNNSKDETSTKESTDNKSNNKSDSTSENISNLESQILTKINKITELEEELEELKNSYLVIYVADSTIVKTYNVKKGKNVPNTPAIPSKTGYNGTWSNDGTNITEDTIIFAEYTVKTYNIYYKLDFGKFNELNIAEFQIEGTNYVYLNDYEAVFKLGNNINSNNTNTFEIDNEEFTYYTDYVTKTSDSQNYYGIAYATYFVFQYNDQMYLLETDSKNLYPCTQHNVRGDNIFEVGNNHYKIGGNEFKIYEGDNSYTIEKMYYILGGYYYYIENNKVYDADGLEITNVVNSKFTLNIDSVDHEYTLDPNYPGANEISATGTFKNESLLPTTYKYGDRVINLPYIDVAINNLTSPRYATPRSWVVNLIKSNNELYLLEDTYGDIYIYIDWSIPS